MRSYTREHSRKIPTSVHDTKIQEPLVKWWASNSVPYCPSFSYAFLTSLVDQGHL